ncbi:MFS transporter [Saccharopolyspora spinosa]|uniref:MFS transporter n=1 Tax=Saccharopolyspora spinosa TaxID=60894 RepID=UPI00030FDC89|nr:MFS transporter [Saccharopolyspora spinosa]
MGRVANPEKSVQFDDVPFGRFHLHVAVSGSGGQFSDGYILGIVGISLVTATSVLGLNAIWLGLLGAASMLGLLVGSLFSGYLIDRIGRRPIFAFDMIVLAILSLVQFWVAAPWQLFVLRLLLGVVLGADYAASKTLVSEFAPRQTRGRMMSLLALSWAAGYAAAYLVGYFIVSLDVGDGAWRWMLASSAVPAVAILLARIGIPESPRWLVAKGRAQEATAILQVKLGSHVTIGADAPGRAKENGNTFRRLFQPPLRRRTILICVFYACHIMPYFALSTFSPRILKALGVSDPYFGGAIYNLLLLAGAVVGMLVIDRIARRSFLVGSFAASAVLLFPLSVLNLPTSVTIALFAVLAFALSARDTLAFIYPQELFPTDLRGTGVGTAVAASRVGASISTFLLPVVSEFLGIHVAMLACVVVLVLGGGACYFYAPETGKSRLGATNE